MEGRRGSLMAEIRTRRWPDEPTLSDAPYVTLEIRSSRNRKWIAVACLPLTSWTFVPFGCATITGAEVLCSHHSGPWKLCPRWRLHICPLSRQLFNDGAQISPPVGQSTGEGGDFERTISHWNDNKVKLVQFCGGLTPAWLVADIVRQVLVFRPAGEPWLISLRLHGSGPDICGACYRTTSWWTSRNVGGRLPWLSADYSLLD